MKPGFFSICTFMSLQAMAFILAGSNSELARLALRHTRIDPRQRSRVSPTRDLRSSDEGCLISRDVHRYRYRWVVKGDEGTPPSLFTQLPKRTAKFLTGFSSAEAARATTYASTSIFSAL